MKTETIKLEQVTVIDGIQQRQGGTNKERVEEYRAVWRELVRQRVNWNSPPVVFKQGKEKNAKYILAGGFTRFEAMRLEGTIKHTFEVKPGGEREALVYALGDNVEHGVRRTVGDLRKAITTLLEHPELKKLSGREAAKILKCDDSYFSQVKREILGTTPDAKKSKAAKKSNEARKPEKAEKTVESTPFDEPTKATKSTEPSTTTAETASVEGAVKPHTADENKPEENKTEQPTAKPATQVVTDSFGRTVPGWLKSVFTSNAAEQFEQAVKTRDAIARSGNLFAEGLFSRAIKELSYTVPHCVCPECGGHGCHVCRNRRGWISKPEFERLPKELKFVAQSYTPENRGEIDEEAEARIAAQVQPPEEYATIRDANGITVPKKLRDAFADVNTDFAASLIYEAVTILTSVTRWNPYIQDATVQTLKGIAELVESAIPNLLCPQCDGKGGKCVHCQTSGFQPVSFVEAK